MAERLLVVFVSPVCSNVVYYSNCIVQIKDLPNWVLCLLIGFIGLMSYLRYLCLFAHSDVQHILCCVFVFDFVFVLLPVWILHFWLPLRYSLTFISKQDVVNWYVHKFMPRPRTDNVTHSYNWVLFPAGRIICWNVINWGNYSQIYHNYYKNII